MDTIQFEAIKTGLRQSKEGYNLTLAVHPDDLPDDLMKDFIGSRYMVVMVRVGDDEQPVVRDKSDGEKAIAIAGMLCRDPVFWDYIKQNWDIDFDGENGAVNWLCDYLELTSRKDLKTNDRAVKLFLKLRKAFDEWKS